MGLETVLVSTLEERDKPDAAALTETVIETLKDDAVRREVYTEAAEELEDISMMEVHEILDCLVRVLRGENGD